MENHLKFTAFVIAEGPLGLGCLDILLNQGHTIPGIATTDAGVKRWADAHHIPHIAPSEDLSSFCGQQSFDYLFSIAHLSVLSPDLIRLPRKMAINFHDGPLPKYAGLNASSWALINGESSHGITWHIMKEEVDSGTILKQRPVPIVANETSHSLNRKCVEAGIDSFKELVRELALGTVVISPQPLAERTYFGRHKRPERAAVISWNQPAATILALIRGLHFGSNNNPLGQPKVLCHGEAFVILEAQAPGSQSGEKPGTIIAISDEGIVVSTTTDNLVVQKLSSQEGHPLRLKDFIERFDIRPGMVLEEPSADTAEKLNAWSRNTARHESYWVEKMAGLQAAECPWSSENIEMTPASAPAQRCEIGISIPASVSEPLLRRASPRQTPQVMLAAFTACLSHITNNTAVQFGLRDAALDRELNGVEAVFSPCVPFRVDLEESDAFEELLAKVTEEQDRTKAHRTFARDMVSRYPSLSHLADADPLFPVQVQLGGNSESVHRTGYPAHLLMRIHENECVCTWEFDPTVIPVATAKQMASQFEWMLKQLSDDFRRPVSTCSLLTPEERELLLVTWNDTSVPVREKLVLDAFEERASRHPDDIAVVFQNRSLTYGELDARANQLANFLRQRGVGPDVLVGICAHRSLEMMLGLVGVLKAGGAYLPLDPGYPRDRIAFMLDDAKAPVLLTTRSLRASLASIPASVICLDADWPEIGLESPCKPQTGVQPDNLAYVLYTSGSTGKPKGVMVEHRNVTNFFTGMDRTIGSEPPGTWLAVTSISFDISVLELFWTLARGFKVVIKPDDDMIAPSGAVPAQKRSAKKIDFSLFYFSSDEAGDSEDKYKLLLEGARFADANGFAAVWTPERHFHAFGGLYPNPSVTSAAIAAITRQVQIRAGSVVVPLHHPVRVAEEWSVVDNLSKGRVGISFASGWQANDYILAPQNYRDNKNRMFEAIETVRKLWRGEEAHYPNGNGESIPVRILPRPVQRELPFWITAAGNPETFRSAGALGANVLTHLLGQSIETLIEKIAVYREAWRQAGHSGEGKVTLMLHTYLDDDMSAVREKVRVPFSNYLRSSVDLIKNAASSFPTFSKSANARELDTAMRSGALTSDDLDALVAHAFERFFNTSALFGTVESCTAMVEKLKEIGVDEIACLIDFGVDFESAMKGLNQLQRLHEESNRADAPDDSGPVEELTVAAQILEHGVTHLQCTPSRARMILSEPGGPQALETLHKLLVGGEPLPASLSKDLLRPMNGALHNMYGPTETTVWSTTARVERNQERIHIGRPIANTEIYILDKRHRPVAVGTPGELYIGGLGVARGYLNRPELTAERFIDHPFKTEGTDRLYRTGDQARYLHDGSIEFLGRADDQVKIRGHRIELKEIEAALETHADIRQAVVTAQADSAESKRLVGYFIPENGASLAAADLRAYLQQKLPEYMIPSVFVSLDAMPLTPNGKVNRRALPTAENARAKSSVTFVAPRTPIEETLASIWKDELRLERIGVRDNFFDLGGNSLLAVQIGFRIRQALNVELQLRTLFDHPTIEALAGPVESKLIEQGDDSTMSDLLAQLEELSDEEAQALLKKELSI